MSEENFTDPDLGLKVIFYQTILLDSLTCTQTQLFIMKDIIYINTESELRFHIRKQCQMAMLSMFYKKFSIYLYNNNICPVGCIYIILESQGEGQNLLYWYTASCQGKQLFFYNKTHKVLIEDSIILKYKLNYQILSYLFLFQFRLQI